MTDFLLQLPAYVKIGSAFLGILIVYRLGVPLGISILIHSLLLTAISGAPLKHGLVLQVQNLGRLEFWLLLAVILSILFFTESLKNTGRMERTITALKQWFTNHHLLLMGLPALVGLLPMPGGAIFSAPFIHSLDTNKTITPAQKTAINYWFRHIWECWWPLYPGVIFAIHYSQVATGTFIALLIPITLAAVASGYFFIIRRVHMQSPDATDIKIDSHAVGETFLPIFLIITTAIGGSSLLQVFHIERIHANLIAMLTGLALAITLVNSSDTATLVKSLQIIIRKNTFFMILVVVGVQSFSASLTIPDMSTGETLVSLMRDEMITIGIPIVLVIILVPFISGIITGVAFAFVGASFPLVFALIGASPEFNIIASTTILAFVAGYVGMILSPVHICLVITSEYFKTNLFSVYPYILGPCISVFIAGVLLSGFYYFLF